MVAQVATEESEAAARRAYAEAQRHYRRALAILDKLGEPVSYYATEPIETFAPLVRRIFTRPAHDPHIVRV